MKAEDYQDGLNLVMTMARMVQLVPTVDMLVALGNAETMGVFLDPTLYQKYLHSDGDDIKEIIQALDKFRRTVDTIKLKHKVKSDDLALSLDEVY